MSIVPPTINPVQIPDGIVTYRPVTDITPFTYRAGVTYQELLERLRVYTTKYLTDYLADEFSEFADSWEGNVSAVIAAVNTALATQASTVSEELATTLTEIVSGANANLNDGMILSALELAGSTSLAYLDGRYAKESRFDPNIVLWKKAGLIADGTTDDSAALITWLASLTVPTILALPVGGVVNLGTGTVNIDISKVQIWGMNSFIVGGTINVFSSVDYYGNQLNWHTLFESVVFRNTTLNITGDFATQPTQGKFRIIGGGMLGGTLNFGVHAWKIAFQHFNIQGTHVNALAGDSARDRGENMVFQECMWGDGVALSLLQDGDWHFFGCSFDNMLIDIAGNSHAFFANSHFEIRAGDNNARSMLNVRDPFSLAVLRDTELVINPGPNGENFERAPFHSDDNVTGTGGVIIDGISVPAQSYMHTENGDGQRILVSGKGHARISRVTSYNNAWQNAYALANAQNVLYNGDAETGDSKGWGTPNGNYINDTGFKLSGSASHKIQAPAGSGTTFFQDMPCEAGRSLWGSMWQVFNGAANAKLNTQIDFFNFNGDKIYTWGYDQLTAATTRHWRTTVRVPLGAVRARLTFYLDNTAGTSLASMNIDAAVINFD